jgi:hypothetical protein
MEGYFSTGQSPQRAVVPMEEEEEEEEEDYFNVRNKGKGSLIFAKSNRSFTSETRQVVTKSLKRTGNFKK